MTGMIVEAVIVAFCVGGAFGAIVAMHLQHAQLRKAELRADELKKAEVRVQPRRFK